MLRLQILLQAVDRLTAPMRAVEARLAAVGAAAQRIGRESGATRLAGAMGRVASSAGNAALAIGRVSATVAGLGTAGAAASGFAFNRFLVRPAADAQNAMMTLTNQMGEHGARAAFAWVENFGRTTPFASGEVLNSFLDIQNLDIDPRGGALQAIGDAAAIIGRGRAGFLDRAGQAYSAALRGEMDPLESFGIQGRRERVAGGGQGTVLDWTTREGQRRRAVVEDGVKGGVGQRERLAAAINEALLSKYEGGMARQSETWDGMLSNLGDSWTRFAQRIMTSGPFQWMNDQLKELLAQIDRLEQDGSMQRWAEQIAGSILVAFNAVRRFIVGTDEEPGFFERMDAIFTRLGTVLGPVIKRFGGLEVALAAIGVLLAGPLIISLAGLTAGIVALGAALVATPAGWFAIAAAGIIALAAAITTNWAGIGDWFGQQISGLLDPFGALERHLTSFRDWGASILSAWEPVASFFERLSAGITAVSNALGAGRAGQAGLDAAPPAIGNVQGRQRPDNPAGGFYGNDGFWNQVTGEGGAAPAPGSAAAPRPAASSPRPVQVQTGGQLNIRVEDGRAPQVTGRPANPDERWSINQGPRLVTP